jgi:hypothetical protein
MATFAPLYRPQNIYHPERSEGPLFVLKRAGRETQTEVPRRRAKSARICRDERVIDYCGASMAH